MSELSQEARALIDSVSKLDDPSVADRARVKQRVAVSLGAAAFTTVALTQAAGGAGPGLLGSARAGLWGTTGKLALCAGVLGGALAIGWPSGQALPRPASVQQQASSAPQQPPQTEPGAAATAAPVPAESPVVQTPVAEQPATDPSLAAPRQRDTHKHAPAADPSLPPERPQAAQEPSTLALELPLLAEAQAALRAGQPDRALALARQHQARFPAGLLREERLGVETLSECALGGKDSARAQAFLRAAPDSPLAPRVRKACGLE